MTAEPADPFAHPAVVGLDRAGERMAASARGNGAVDRALYALSQAGNHSVLWHGINAVDAAVGVVTVATAGRRDAGAGDRGRRRVLRALRRSTLLGVEQALVNVGVKGLVGRVRPDHDLEHPHGLRTPRTSSFPSGHASAGACAALLLTRDLGAAPLWWGLAAAVAWSRVHVGAHHTSDVVGGAAVGVVLGSLAGRLWPTA